MDNSRLTVRDSWIVALTRRSSLSLDHISLALFALAWVVPFLQPYHRYPIPSFYSEWSAAAFGLAACVALIRWSAWRRFNFPLITLGPVALALLVLCQAALGLTPYVGQGLLAAMYLVWASLLIVTGAALTQRLGMSAVASALALSLVLGGECSAFVGVLQDYGIETAVTPYAAQRVGMSAYGNIAQSNHYATYAALALASVAYLYARSRFRAVIGLCIMAVPLVLALALSDSRSAWLYLVALLVLALVLRIKRNDEETRRLLLATGVFVIAFGALQWLGVGSGGSTVTEQILSEPIDTSRIGHARMALWTFMQSPVWGVGWGHLAWYDFQYLLLSGTRYENGPTSNAHNIILQLLAEVGLAGTLIVVSAAMWWLMNFLKKQMRLDHWWILALLVVLTIHSMFEYPLWYTYFLGIAAILLGMAGPATVRNLRHMAPLGTLILLVGFVELATLGWNYRDLERITSVDIGRMDERTIEEILLRTEGEPVLRPYGEYAAVYGIPASRDFIETRLALNTRVMHFSPSSAVLYREAMLLAISGRHDAAMEQLNNAIRVYRADLRPWVLFLRKHVADFPELEPLLKLAVAQSGKPQ